MPKFCSYIRRMVELYASLLLDVSKKHVCLLSSQFQQVWKDVDGVLTCNLSIYPLVEPVPYLSFDEAAELAYFGAQVRFLLLYAVSILVVMYNST